MPDYYSPLLGLYPMERNLMGGFLSLLKNLPLMLEMAVKMEKLLEEGVTVLEIRAAMRSIDKAFIQTKASERARDLNDVFRKP